MAASKRKRKRRLDQPRHGSEGRYEPIARVVVDNPTWEPAKDGVGGVPKKIEVVVNRRHDIVLWLHSRGDIDDAQRQAGDRFLALHEQMQSGFRATDYSREPVDGGSAWPETDVKVSEAAKELDKLRSFLGWKDYLMLERAICHRSSIHGITVGLYGEAREADRKYIGRRLRDALEMAAKYWGYAK